MVEVLGSIEPRSPNNHSGIMNTRRASTKPEFVPCFFSFFFSFLFFSFLFFSFLSFFLSFLSFFSSSTSFSSSLLLYSSVEMIVDGVFEKHQCFAVIPTGVVSIVSFVSLWIGDEVTCLSFSFPKKR